MSVCIHGNLCREILNETGYIYSRKCPKDCPFFEEKYKEVPAVNNTGLKLKRVEIVMED